MALDLNEKPWYVPALIAVIIGVVLYAVLNAKVFNGIRESIKRTEDEIAELQREINKGEAAKRNSAKLKEEIKQLEMELAKLRKILPTRRETDDLIKKLNQLAERGHFQINRFKPMEFVDKDFLWEWPIEVELEGTYHELGKLFDRLGRYSRIINVTDVDIGRSKAKGYTIHANFVQKTFIYKEQEAGG